MCDEHVFVFVSKKDFNIYDFKMKSLRLLRDLFGSAAVIQMLSSQLLVG